MSGSSRAAVFLRTGSAPAMAVVAGAAYSVGSLVGLELRLPPATPSVLWPPNAILTALLLFVPPARWWSVLLGAAGAHFAVQLPGVVSRVRHGNLPHKLQRGAVRRWPHPIRERSALEIDTLGQVSVFLVIGGLAAPLEQSGCPGRPRPAAGAHVASRQRNPGAVARSASRRNRVTCARDQLMGRQLAKCRGRPPDLAVDRPSRAITGASRRTLPFITGDASDSGKGIQAPADCACSNLSHVRVAARRSIPTQPRGRGRFPSGPPVGPSRSSQEGSGSSAGP